MPQMAERKTSGIGLTRQAPDSIIARMTRYTLPFALLGLMLLIPACRHRTPHASAADTPYTHYSHEEAEPVSNLPHEEFSKVTPQQRRGKR